MRILVCGGRDYSNYERVLEVLSDYMYWEPPEDVIIIHGKARGADSLAGRAAQELGFGLDVYPADWNRYGKSAGYKRNTQMLVEGKPDRVIAFPGGRGTAMMVRIAREAGVPVFEIT